MKLPAHLAGLIEKAEAGTASPEEIARLNEWYHSFDDTTAHIYTDDPNEKAALETRMRERLLSHIKQEQTPVIPVWRRTWFRAAAAVLLVLVAGSYFILRNPATKAPQLAKTILPVPAADILPGGNKAVLTLADGSTIILDSAANGILGTQGNMKIEKLENGLLAYNLDGKWITENDAAFYNTIRTPRGGQYQVTLSDGTRVWLNAASSIRFPVFFTGKERRVEVTGETYFEVAKNAAKPFHVNAGNTEVEVLGTHFNVNAYEDESAIKTTLLEGKVKVTGAAQAARFLQPGQQSGVTKNGEISVNRHADTEEAVAWIKGRFQFNSADLRSMLRQIARWYDVDVEYRGNVDLHFTGQLTRSERVNKLFEKLEMTGEVHFRVEGRKIIVTR